MFEKTFFAGWADMDFNSHMRNTAFSDKSGDIRMMFMAEHGFPVGEFKRLMFGPVVMKDEIEYFKEVNLLEEIKVNMIIAGLSDDGSRYKMRNEFYKANNKLAGRITSTGGWMDLRERKLIAPPEKLLEGLNLLPRSEDFQILPSSIMS